MSNKQVNYTCDDIIQIIQEINVTDLKKIVKIQLQDLGTPSILASIASQLLIKTLALIVDKWKGELKNVSKKGLTFLHESLSKYSVYKFFTADILDKLFQNLIDANNQNTIHTTIQDIHNKEKAFNEIEEMFESLTDEQKLTILANKELQKEITTQSNNINNLAYVIKSITEPDFKLQLKDEGEYVPETEGTAHWFSYKAEKSTYVEREDERNVFDHFLNSDRKLLFMAIVGQGGMGKNRFLYEQMKNLNDWEAGFCKLNNLEINKINKWIPNKPYLVVIDYASEEYDNVNQLLDILANKSGWFLHPFRVVLLERSIDEKSIESWWSKLLAHDRGKLQKHLYSSHESKLVKSGILALSGFSGEGLEKMFEAWSSNFTNTSTPPANDKEFWNSVSGLVGEGRPLFIGMAAYIYATEGRQALLTMTIRDILQNIYINDDKHFLNKTRNEDLYKQAKKLCILAIFLGGINVEDDNFKSIINTLNIEKDRDELIRLARAFAGNINMQIQPDILAEYFILQWMQCEDDIYLLEDEKTLLKLAIRYGDTGFASFFYKFIRDFPISSGNIKIFNWFDFIVSDIDLQTNEIQLFAMVLMSTALAKDPKEKEKRLKKCIHYADQLLRKYDSEESAICFITIATYQATSFLENNNKEEFLKIYNLVKIVYSNHNTKPLILGAYSSFLTLALLGAGEKFIAAEIERLYNEHNKNESVVTLYVSYIFVVMSFSISAEANPPLVKECIHKLEQICQQFKNNILLTNHYAKGLIAATAFYKTQRMQLEYNMTIKKLKQIDRSIADKETLDFAKQFQDNGILPKYILSKI